MRQSTLYSDEPFFRTSVSRAAAFGPPTLPRKRTAAWRRSRLSLLVASSSASPASGVPTFPSALAARKASVAEFGSARFNRAFSTGTALGPPTTPTASIAA